MTESYVMDFEGSLTLPTFEEMFGDISRVLLRIPGAKTVKCLGKSFFKAFGTVTRAFPGIMNFIKGVAQDASFVPFICCFAAGAAVYALVYRRKLAQSRGGEA